VRGLEHKRERTQRRTTEPAAAVSWGGKKSLQAFSIRQKKGSGREPNQIPKGYPERERRKSLLLYKPKGRKVKKVKPSKRGRGTDQTAPKDGHPLTKGPGP